MSEIIKNTITPSEIINVCLVGFHGNADPEASRVGIAAHKEIGTQIIGGKIPLALMETRVVYGEIEREKIVSREIVPRGLFLNAKCDLICEGAVVEFKPGNEFFGRYNLQAVLGAAASGDEKDAVVYLYNCGRAYVIKRRIITECKSILYRIADGARTILDIQSEVDELKKNPPPRRRLKGIKDFAFETERIGGDVNKRGRLCEKSIEVRREFDENIKNVMSKINPPKK